MTEAQVATLARRGVVLQSNLSQAQASLLIDETTASTHERRALCSGCGQSPGIDEVDSDAVEVWQIAGRQGGSPGAADGSDAQGATYRGESFTLAGDDTIHLEAVHVALSRGTKANTLYYAGEPPPDEDHEAVETATLTFEELVAAAGRSRAQVMALDLLDAPAPMTESRVATLVRRGVVPEKNLTWDQPSLLIDDTRSERAANRPSATRANAQEAASASPGPRRPDAMDVRLEVLETAARSDHPLSPAAVGEVAALRSWQADAARARRREQREAWARQAPSVANVPNVAANHASPRRTGR